MFPSCFTHSCSSQLPPSKPFRGTPHSGDILFFHKKNRYQVHSLLTDITDVNTTTYRLNTLTTFLSWAGGTGAAGWNSRQHFPCQKGQKLHRHPKYHQGSFGGPPLSLPAPTGDGMEGAFWDQTPAMSKGGPGHFFLKSPHQPWPFPAAEAAAEKLKLGRGSGGCSSLGPAPSPQTAPRGAASREESRDRTWSLQPPWRHHERWGQCEELLSDGIRNRARRSSGESRQRAAGAWGQPAQGAGTSPSASGSPAPGRERSGLGAPQASGAQGRLCPSRERRSH